jgi:hypothetical protein
VALIGDVSARTVLTQLNSRRNSLFLSVSLAGRDNETWMSTTINARARCVSMRRALNKLIGFRIPDPDPDPVFGSRQMESTVEISKILLGDFRAVGGSM